MKISSYIFILMSCTIIAGCSQEKKAPVSQEAAKAPLLMKPFKYHKLMEVSPGQYYDVFSWGRIAADTAGLLILHTDSTGKKYTTTTGGLNGSIIDVYNADMDVDGNPEILIQVKSKDTVNYTTIQAFEFNDNKVQKLDFPKLTGSQRKGYRGDDNFYIQEGKLIREFLVYAGSGKDAKVTGEQRKLEYGLSSNSFTVKQLSKDSASVSNKMVVSEPVKKQSVEKKTTTKKTKKHHAKPEKHKKKHRRHRG